MSIINDVKRESDAIKALKNIKESIKYGLQQNDLELPFVSILKEIELITEKALQDLTEKRTK